MARFSIPLAALLLVLIVGRSGRSAEPESDAPTEAELGSIMKTLMLTAVPAPLVEQSFDWGKQRMVPVGVKWERDGLILKPKTMEKLHNDGTWRKVRVDADDIEKNLAVSVSNLQTPGKGRVLFDMVVTLKTNIKFEQQIWKSGVRLYSGETRARCRPTVNLKCESVTRVEKTTSFIPDVVMRMRVLDAKLTYDQFVVEHTAGIGGDAAKLLGEAIQETVRQWKPSLERNMLEKANQAIVKAGDTKEIRLSLSKFLEGK